MESISQHQLKKEGHLYITAEVKMSHKRKLRDDQEPFMVQHHPLTSDQLCDLLGAQEDEVMEAVVSQVSEPKAGQVFLVDCAGARFARYDYHRWTAYYHHNGLGPLLPPSTPDPLQDWMEIRYNKKLGSHGHLGLGAIRIVYKLKSEERHVVEAPGVAAAPFRIIHYLEKLPAQVESAITQHLEEENARMRLQEENQRKEREAEEKRKEIEGAQKGESKFGRRRKPNSRYSELYSLETIKGKVASGESQSDEELAEAGPSRGMSSFLKMPGMKGNSKGQGRGGYAIDLSPRAGDSPTTDEVKITITHSDLSNPICSDASNPISASLQSSEILTGADSGAIHTSNPTEEPCKSPAENIKAEGVPPRRKKCLGRPRYRGLQNLPLKRKKGEKEDEKEKIKEEKDEIKMDYSPGVISSMSPLTEVLDNYCWTDKGFKRWPTDSSGSATRLLCYHSPMRITRNAMCTALMRHEFRLPSPDTQDVRVVHYMPTREFREYVVIANAAKQMQKVTEAVWHDLPLPEDVAPLQTSSSRLRPCVVWELLTQGNASSVILVPQAGGDSPDILEWEDIAQLQIQPRVYQVLEVCQRVTGDKPRLIRLCYTSRKVPYKVLVHYLGDPRPYVDLSVNVLTTADGDDTPAGKEEQGEQKTELKEKADEEGGKGSNEETEKNSIAQSYLRNDQLYKISPHHLREVGCVGLKPEDLDVEVEATFQHSSNQLEEILIPPDKPGLYHYGHRMMKKRIIRLLENLNRSRKTVLPIKNPEAGEAYLVTKPTNKTVMDPYKWTQKGWTPIPRKDPVVLWRWGLLRHKKHAWAPPLIRIDYVHLHVNTDLMLLHYVPTKDNENMLEIRSSMVPVSVYLLVS
ncbi:hypothetical protein E2C01_010787 [Portunus trituberculatus]|uniref:Uncharacterized protein n=1 Tax=Portunus trituberculatus TaxID=210409 RepID=A0A5B7D9K2_PORTR|nr:hypothetical protein [Portunus trituberculatus]